MSAIPVDGTLTRKLLPHGAGGMRGAFQFARSVTWHVEPITYGQALAHLAYGDGGACVVCCHRGPAGGWTGAAFVTVASDLGPMRRYMQRSDAPLTMYYGWKHGCGVMHPDDLWRAHLMLHAVD